MSSFDYAEESIKHLQTLKAKNVEMLSKVTDALETSVKAGSSLFIFGSGHSSLFPLEMYHRAGGASYVIPLVAEYLTPMAGPPVVRAFERTPGVANILLAQHEPKPGEMVWIASQSGINGAVVDFAIEAKKRGLVTVSFSSHPHSSQVESRHPSKKRLYEICDYSIDLGGVRGDAIVPIKNGDVLKAGPVSLLSMVYLGYTIIVECNKRLENMGVRCTYTSVNTPEGEALNKSLEAIASKRDHRLRE